MTDIINISIEHIVGKIITVFTCYLWADLPICISLMSRDNIFTVIPLLLKQHMYMHVVCVCVYVWACVVESVFLCVHVDCHKKFLTLYIFRL